MRSGRRPGHTLVRTLVRTLNHAAIRDLCCAIVFSLVLCCQIVSPAMGAAFGINAGKTEVASIADIGGGGTLSHLAAMAIKALPDESRCGSANQVCVALGETAETEAHGLPISAVMVDDGGRIGLRRIAAPKAAMIGAAWSTGPPQLLLYLV